MAQQFTSTKPPYCVEIDKQHGCENCGHGDQYMVVFTPTQTALSVSYSDEEDADYIAEMLNAAYELGRQQVILDSGQ